MIKPFSISQIMQDCRSICFIFACCLTAGAVLGVIATNSLGANYLLMMRMACGSRVSIVGTVLTVCVPFSISYLLITHSKPWLVYFICTLHIFLFSSAAYAFNVYFGTSGWMIRIYMQFTEFALIPALLYFSILRLRGRLNKQMLYQYILITVIVGMIDYSWISPYLADLLVNYETMGRYAIHVRLDWCL